MTRVDTALLVLRLVVGLTLVAHGLNHAFGGGKLPGAARWFESMGLRPGIVHAFVSAAVEVAAGFGLAAGFLTLVAAAGAVGVMTVAGVTAHRPNGFFVFKDGYEYVLMIATVAFCLAVAGPGKASLDHAVGLHWPGWVGALVAGGGGLGGAALLLVTSWRPGSTANAPAPEPASTGVEPI